MGHFTLVVDLPMIKKMVVNSKWIDSDCHTQAEALLFGGTTPKGAALGGAPIFLRWMGTILRIVDIYIHI